MATPHTPSLPWWGPARLPFLALTPACVALAVAWSHWRLAALGQSLNGLDLALVLCGALAAHLSVNALNEHHDFGSGLDARTQRTPFSGGSGALPEHPELAPLAWRMGLAGLLVACGLGLWLLARHPAVWSFLVPLGLIGLLLVVAYTPWLTRHPFLCLMAPGVGFGPLMGLGTQLVLCPPGEGLNATGVALTLIPLGLVNNLLLLNQFPDVEADRSVGRLTLPMRWGRSGCVPMLGAQYVLAYGVLLVLLASRRVPACAALGLLTAPLAWQVWRSVRRHADDIPALLPAMGQNVVVSLITPSLVALGLWLA
ncbi:prenyltransferase [Aquabacterium sp.]|uniref:prenyltransferase n=1 Tax=Aquabacterium sp. TaxID=1872578 RepID=UPI0025B83E11|nr:prenyltransferase [Aquabacterium sp.]